MKSETVKVKAIVLVICALFLAALSGVSSSNTGNAQNNQSKILVDTELNHAPSTPEYVPDEIIVRFKPDIGEHMINAINTLHETYEKRTLLSGSKLLSVPQGKSVEEIVQLYEGLPEVQYAEPSYIGYGFMAPNDPIYQYQWHLDNSTNEYRGINMESAWDISTGEGVVVAVLDSGVAYEDYGPYCQAPDLAGTNFVQGYDFVNNDEHPNDDYWHGTHVTGTIEAVPQ